MTGAIAVAAWSRELLQSAESTATAVVSLERRAMNAGISGAEAGRQISVLLHEFNPHGDPSTWRPLHSRRGLLELQAVWSRACRASGVRPTAELWALVTEGGYDRAAEEL